MEYDETYIKELRGLSEHIKSLDGEDKIRRIVERCIKIKRQLNKLESQSVGVVDAEIERKKDALLNEYFRICHGGTKETRAVREILRCYNYFIDALEIDYKKSLF